MIFSCDTDLEHEDEKEQQNEVYKEDLHAHNDVDSAQKEEVCSLLIIWDF